MRKAVRELIAVASGSTKPDHSSLPPANEEDQTNIPENNAIVLTKNISRGEVIAQSDLKLVAVKNTETFTAFTDFKNLIGKKVTYHDPCYLGRANNVYDKPRELIKSLGVELVEMKRNKRLSFCCGAGGGQMFKEPENGTQEININRTEEALSLNPDIIATGCPFCNTMMTDGVKSVNEGSAEVLDIAELIADNL